MRGAVWVLTAGLLGAGVVAQAQLPPPTILKEDCSTLRGKAKTHCEKRNAAGDVSAVAAKPDSSDMPTGADADVPGEPPTPRPAGAKAAAKPNTSDMPTGKDADPPASSMGPLRPDGTPDTEGPPRPPASSSSSSSSGSPLSGSSSSGSSSSSSADDDDVAPTTSGSDTPVKAATLKDLGSHADSSAARVKLEQNRVADDVKVGRFYLRDGNLSGAEARFKDAIEHDPNDPEARFAMAELLLKQKRNGEAAAQLQQYLTLAPDDEHTKDARRMLAKLGK
ncbi:tetratricopeptide repeat protein [Terriglobus sp.]|uniref:tetratricopeptide repeat protein n=1 Tax=Terriglobus sp. TaxID=1889013 RepID=UPI003B006A52